MYEKIKILYIEDSENDAVLLTHHLRSLCKDIYYKRVESKSGIINALKTDNWDVIIIDNTLPAITAIEAIELIKKNKVESPMICVSGSEMYDIKDQCIGAGAENFILKDNSEEFVKAIETILEQCFG